MADAASVRADALLAVGPRLPSSGVPSAVQAALLPTMLGRGYHPSIAMGPIMASGAIAMLIPPSALAVLVGSGLAATLAAGALAWEREPICPDGSPAPETPGSGGSRFPAGFEERR